MKKKKKKKKKTGLSKTSVFLVKPKGQLRPVQDHTITYPIIDVVKWRHKFVPMSIRVYNFEEL